MTNFVKKYKKLFREGFIIGLAVGACAAIAALLCS
jgi:hypothetical protein